MDKTIFMELLHAREFKAVRSILNVMNAVDIAALMTEFDDKELAQAFRLIPKSKAADVFAEMNSSMQSYLVKIFTEDELKDLLNELFLDDTVDLLEDLPANLVTRILENVDTEKRNRINQLLNYPEDSAGSVMTTEYVDLKKYTTVREALTHIKQTGIHKETIYTCYILENRRLLGIVSAKDLMTMDDDMTMEELMETEIISVSTHTDQEEVGRLFSKYGLLALPVLDLDGLMVGIVTFALMGAVTPSEKPYFETSILEHAKNRIVWLLVLMISSTFTGMVITRYEDAFAVVPLLVSFIPMLMDTGGNCGSQSSTLIIRGLALDEIKLGDVFRVLFKEFRISLIVGIALSLANGLRIWIMYKSLTLAVVVSLSLMATIIISKLIGGLLPLFAKKLHCDPAIMAAPLITTIVDACSIMIYFRIATLIFHL